MRIRRHGFALLAAGFAALALNLPTPASAALLITVDKTSQRMTVERDSTTIFNWPVSTGQRGYDTPAGDFKPFRMEKDHFSREWDDAPMPNSIFFTTEGHAIHGSYDTKRLGRPASHGCVRLSPQHAKVLFDLVKQEGMANTKVVLTGNIPGGAGVPVAKRAPREDDDEAEAEVTVPRQQRRYSGDTYYSDNYYYGQPRRYYYREPMPSSYRRLYPYGY